MLKRNAKAFFIGLFLAWAFGAHATVQLLPDDKVDSAPEVDAINRNFIALQQDKLDAQNALPALAKGWVSFAGTGTLTVLDSYNVTSVTDTGTGDYLITWDTDFLTANYAVVVTSRRAAGTNGFSRPNTQTAGAVQIQTFDAAAVATDHELVNVVAFGD